MYLDTYTTWLAVRGVEDEAEGSGTTTDFFCRWVDTRCRYMQVHCKVQLSFAAYVTDISFFSMTDQLHGRLIAQSPLTLATRADIV